MPNWCQTRITINHEDENKLKELESNINKWISYNHKENGFGLNWLGNIVGNSKVGTVDENPETDLRCRGWVDYMQYNDNQLIIDVETAWSPMLKMWVKVLEKYLPDAELIYTAEECGNELYCTNDNAMNKEYIIDAYGDIDVESDWYAPEEKVVSILQELLKTDENDVNKLIDLFEDSDCYEEMNIHKWEFEEVDAWD
jgi:hypothetical protein